MDKRTFLQALTVTSTLPATALAKNTTTRAAGPTVLTISGDVAHPNRGMTDDALDQLMHKHGLSFRQARTFDYAALAALPTVEIRPTLEYDAKPHALRGPLLIRLLEVAGVRGGDSSLATLRAFDGYTVELSLKEIREHRFIVATHMDGSPLPLGGLGPLWAVFDADRVPELANRPLSERFARCPWGLYSVHIPGSPG